MKQMVEAYNEVGGNLISVLEVPEEEVSSYGVIAPGARISDTLTEVTGLVEKPKREDAPSNLIISGRYILQPEVMRVLEGQEKGAGGEIQLTDAMAQMIGQQPFHAVKFAGRRFDCGSKAGFVEAQRQDEHEPVRRDRGRGSHSPEGKGRCDRDCGGFGWPAKAQETLRTALAMGADRAILVQTDDEVEVEPLAVAKIIKAYCR
jgi:dTDP-glucose pyrophosphorylase